MISVFHSLINGVSVTIQEARHNEPLHHDLIVTKGFFYGNPETASGLRKGYFLSIHKMKMDEKKEKTDELF